MSNRPLSFDDIPFALTVEELMPILHVGRNAAYKLVHSGQIRRVRIGKHLRVLKPDLQQFLTGGTVTNATWTGAAAPCTLEGDSCRAVEGGNEHAAR